KLSYTEFLTDVQLKQVQTATIDASGGVTGMLKDGSHYTSQIPTAIDDTQLAQTLRENGVQITATGPPGTTLLGIILSFLPLLLFAGVFIWLGRRAGRQMAGGLGGVIGSRAKLYDQEKPTTRFSDVAGYDGAKREVTEVVDFLKNPNRYKKIGAQGP